MDNKKQTPQKSSSTTTIILISLILAFIPHSYASRGLNVNHEFTSIGRHLTAQPAPNSNQGSIPSLQWSSIYSGDIFTCALTVGAITQPWCWGSTFFYLNGTIVSSAVPLPLSPDPNTDIIDIATGGNFMCLLYKSNSSAYCIGNAYEDGLDFGTGQTLPGTWKSLSASYLTLCGIKTDDTLWCRGRNDNGQLGAGFASDRSSEFLQVAPGTTWKDVTTGSSNTCGIQAVDGSLWCWGDNTDAQLGVDYAKYGGGDSSGRGYLFKTNVPLPVNVPDNVGWKSVSLNSVSGTKDTACAVKEGGTAWCWGYNGNGQAGIGSTKGPDEYIQYPRQVTTPENGPQQGKWQSITVGTDVTCGINDQKTYCFGDNTRGSIGIGTTNNIGDPAAIISTPVQVAGGGSYSSVSSGGSYSCGIKSPSNELACWGFNVYGTLGNNSTDISNKPTPLVVAADSIVGAPAVAPASNSATQSPSGNTATAPSKSTSTPGSAPKSNSPARNPSISAPKLSPSGSVKDSDLVAKTPSSSPASDSDSTSDSSSGAPIGAIVGGVVGGVVLIAAILLGYMYWRRSKRTKEATGNQATKWNTTLRGEASNNPSAPPLGSTNGAAADPNTPVIDSATEHHLKSQNQAVLVEQNITSEREVVSPFVLSGASVNSQAMNTPFGATDLQIASYLSADTSTGNNPLDRSNSSSFFRKMLDKLRSDKHHPTAAAVGAGVVVGAAAVAGGAMYAESSQDQKFNYSLEDLPPKSSALASDPLLKFIRSMSGGTELSNAAKEIASLKTNAAASIGSAGSGSTAISTTSSALAVAQAGSGRPSSGLVDVRPWMFNFDELDLIKILGEGSFGKVYLARWRETAVAVKVLLDVPETSSDQQAAVSISSPVLGKLQEEAALMATLRSPHVCNFMGICVSPPCIASEYCKKGSLYQVIREANANPKSASELTWQLRLRMALGASKGMLYLHAHNPPIIHRDLKSPNLLVGAHWEIKVADFGLGKLMEENVNNAHSTTTSAFNPRWLANEVIAGDKATTKSDVFSFGVVMWEMLTFQLPWPIENVWGIAKAIGDGQRLDVPPYDQLPGLPRSKDGATINTKAVEEYIKLMQRCWDQKPAKRPDFQEIIVKLRDILGLSSSGESQITRTMF